MNWEARSIAVVAALITLPLTGCGGGTPSDGLEDKSAAQVQEEAAAAIRAAKSVHVIGTSVTDGASAQVDLRIQDGSSSGTITLEGAQFEITRVGEVTYVKADEEALESLGVPPEMPRLGADRWLKLGPQEASGLEGFSLDSFAQQLTTSESPLETEVEQTELDGTRVVVISNQDGSKLYIANADPAYPIRGELKGANAGRIDFSEYDVDFQISAPENSVELGELAWLDAITNLRAKIDEPFLASRSLSPRKQWSRSEACLANAVLSWLESAPRLNACSRSTRSSRRPARCMTRARNASTPRPVSATEAAPSKWVHPRSKPRQARSTAASLPMGTAATS